MTIIDSESERLRQLAEKFERMADDKRNTKAERECLLAKAKMHRDLQDQIEEFGRVA